MKRFAAILGSALMGTMLATVADAANPEAVTTEVEFVAPITITAVTNLKFGLLETAMLLNDTVTVNPDSSWSESASNVAGGAKAAASMTITSLGTTGITITADNPVDGTYWTLDTFMCNYDSGSDTACSSGYNVTSPAGGIATLLVGAMLTGAGGASAGTDNGSFDVTVIYQ